MPEIKAKTDANKLEELKTSLLSLKKDLNAINKDIDNAITRANETWKDDKFKDFRTDYKKYQQGITKFEADLEKAAKVTLPPLIKAAEDYDKIK